jgi:hypothetical protein
MGAAAANLAYRNAEREVSLRAIDPALLNRARS